jgi:hypothetical protein
MAIIPSTLVPLRLYEITCLKWENLANGDEGEPIEMQEYFDRSVQVAGIFGASGEVVLEGTIDGDNWSTLTNGIGDSLTFTTSKIQFIAELVHKVRPKVTNGDGTTDVTVTLFLRKSR